MRDTTSNNAIRRAISPVSVADNTATVSQVIDRQGFDAVKFIIAIGSVADADATFTVLLEESDVSGSGYTAVADIDMISQTHGVAPEVAASFQHDSDNQVRKLGYIGGKRFLRLTITPANNASAALFSAVAELEQPSLAPVTQPAA